MQETFLPDGVGYPFGTDEHEYYMVDLHYDNPQLVPNLNFTTGAEIFYTDILRWDISLYFSMLSNLSYLTIQFNVSMRIFTDPLKPQH